MAPRTPKKPKSTPKSKSTPNRPASGIDPNFNKWEELAAINYKRRDFKWMGNDFDESLARVEDEPEILKRLVASKVPLSNQLKDYILKKFQEDKHNVKYDRDFYRNVAVSPIMDEYRGTGINAMGNKFLANIKQNKVPINDSVKTFIDNREQGKSQPVIRTPIRPNIFRPSDVPQIKPDLLNVALLTKTALEQQGLIQEEEEDIKGIKARDGNLTDSKAIGKTPTIGTENKEEGYYTPKKELAKTVDVLKEMTTLLEKEDLDAESKAILEALPLTSSVPATPAAPAAATTVPAAAVPATTVVPDPIPEDPATATIATNPDDLPLGDTTTANVNPSLRYRPKYHLDSLLLFFGNNVEPDWDLELERNVLGLKWDSKQTLFGIKSILDQYAEKFFTSIKTNGIIGEFLELIQLEFLLLRNLQRGTRAKIAMVPVSSLISFANKLNTDAPADPAQGQGQAQAQGQTQNVKDNSKVINITANQAKANIIKAFDARNTDYHGKPLANEEIVAATQKPRAGTYFGLNDPKDPMNVNKYGISYKIIPKRRK